MPDLPEFMVIEAASFEAYCPKCSWGSVHAFESITRDVALKHVEDYHPETLQKPGLVKNLPGQTDIFDQLKENPNDV